MTQHGNKFWHKSRQVVSPSEITFRREFIYSLSVRVRGGKHAGDQIFAGF